MWEGEKQAIDTSIIESEITFYSKMIRVALDKYEMEYVVIDEATFGKLAKDLGWSDIQKLRQNEVFAIDAFFDERWSEKLDSVTINKVEFPVAKFYDKVLFNVETLGGNAIVVPEQLYDEIKSDETLIQAVKVTNYKNQSAVSDRLAASTENFSSATADYKNTIESLGALLFVGSFLGLVFLVATGSIIFFKMMTEAEEDKAKYAILHKIGVSKKDMNRTIRGQVGVIFTVPLVLGLIHGGVALVAVSNMFMMDFLVPVVIWMLAYTMIYAMYYFATVRSFIKTIRRGYLEG
ncbi:YjbE family integral membrane protein [Sporosarcina newyorkensis 2681]|uniref:YjbE family integral membrane protein n=2 Tax=Sporosarcina newyorkensis TaxID=759851 RepID=F9DT12_9BACL|nr:YjbE family integral membrane protein [Sporosarcina newyorkensis 2681]